GRRPPAGPCGRRAGPRRGDPHRAGPRPADRPRVDLAPRPRPPWRLGVQGPCASRPRVYEGPDARALLTPSWGAMSAGMPLWELCARLFAAALAGAIVGLHFEYRERPGGLRTHLLTSFAA